MNHRLRNLILASVPAALVSLVPATSFAEDNPCGGIEFTSISECHFELSGGCEAECTPLNLVASCDGQCDASISADCTASCEADCSASCEVDPGSFDCSGGCEADCQASAGAHCDSGDNDCVAYAEASCKSECDIQCNATPPSADCSAKCEASCSGSCNVDANFDCEVDCSASLQGGCKADCQAPEGALFCNGQFINVTDLTGCIDYILTEYEYTITFDVTGSVSSSCAASPQSTTSTGMAGMFGLVTAAGIAIARRRNKKG